MMHLPARTPRSLVIVTIALLASILWTGAIGSADSVTAKPGLAPQFRTWPVPLYPSSVSATRTWAPNSYEIDTSDARPRVIAWFLGKLKSRGVLLHKHASHGIVPAQIAVDGGDYVINFTYLRSGTTIGVIKNE